MWSPEICGVNTLILMSYSQSCVAFSWRLRLDDRTTHLSKLEPRIEDFHEDFRKYFPILEGEVQAWKANNVVSPAKLNKT